MNRKQRAVFIANRLQEMYPNPKVPLNHKNSFTLLIAVLLSAQCTDERVNIVTKELFNVASSPEEMLSLGHDKIYNYIKSCGLAPKKTKAIVETSKILIDQHNSKVPKDIKALEDLPGVGHKTASVVLNQAFGIETFPVDTHIHRLAQRWDLTNGKSVVQTEKDLKNIFPKKYWNRLHLQIIWYGREYCKARDCYGLTCKICKKCYPNRKKPIKTKKA